MRGEGREKGTEGEEMRREQRAASREDGEKMERRKEQN
jgi:hypothetical protein